MSSSSLYWIGPHGCLVPNECRTCIAADGGNFQDMSGGITEMQPCWSPPTKEEYLNMYCRKEGDNYIYVPGGRAWPEMLARKKSV